MGFLAPSSKAPRLSLGAMPKAQRALVHEYAESGFGLVSHSTGNEPNRAVQVFKTPSSGGFAGWWRLWFLACWLGFRVWVWPGQPQYGHRTEPNRAVQVFKTPSSGARGFAGARVSRVCGLGFWRCMLGCVGYSS
jgi:hypothetical protein